MEENAADKKPSLFAHPLTFLLTHVALPLLATSAVAYIWWLVCGELEGALYA